MKQPKIKGRKRTRREGAAMIMTLGVLMMTTAMATFAMHTTTIEIRSAGYMRQALQAEYVAEGGAYAGISYVEQMPPIASLAQELRTEVDSNVSSSPGEASIDRDTNLLRIRREDFDSVTGVHAPPLETELARTPSLGPRNTNVADFTVDGTDVYRVSRDRAGEDLSGRGARFYRITLTSRAQLAPPGDFRATGDTRDYHETAARARAVAEVGPFWLGGH
jgi:hypothetical protein